MALSGPMDVADCISRDEFVSLADSGFVREMSGLVPALGTEVYLNSPMSICSQQCQFAVLIMPITWAIFL